MRNKKKHKITDLLMSTSVRSGCIDATYILLYCLASSCISSMTVWAWGMLLGLPTTLMFRPPIMTPFICSRASWAASGISYSTNANPLCFCVTGSHDMLIDFIGPKGRNDCLMVSSFSSKLILPTYTLFGGSRKTCCFEIVTGRLIFVSLVEGGWWRGMLVLKVNGNT